MGKCILHFDRIQIIDKRIDNASANNGWMIVHWFVGRNGRQSNALPLANALDPTLLESGGTIPPFSLEIDCQDDELVTAVYQIVNLGGHDALGQVKVAGAIALQSAEALTQAYVEAAEFVVENNGSPMNNVLDSSIDEVQSAITDSIATAFEQTIIPSLDALSDSFAESRRSGNCSGDVLHDLAIFRPLKSMPPLRMQSKTYTARTESGRSSAARTIVHLTLERRLQVVPWLPSEPASEVEKAPVNPSTGNR